MRTNSVLRGVGSAVAVALAVITLSSCGSDSADRGSGSADRGGGSGDKSAGASPSDPARARTYDEEHTRIRVAPGERFALKLKENPSTGYVWVIDPPKPDDGVVKQTGKRLKGADPDLVGSGGSRYLDFRAQSPGRTSVKLRSCFRCGTSSERTDDEHKATKVTFEVTVQK